MSTLFYLPCWPNCWNYRAVPYHRKRTVKILAPKEKPIHTMPLFSYCRWKLKHFNHTWTFGRKRVCSFIFLMIVKKSPASDRVRYKKGESTVCKHQQLPPLCTGAHILLYILKVRPVLISNWKIHWTPGLIPTSKRSVYIFVWTFSPEIRDIKIGVQLGRNEDSDSVLHVKFFFGVWSENKS